MAHTAILYLGSLMWRSLCLGVLSLFGMLFIRDTARRHALWCAVLAAMLLMPILDGTLAPATISLPIHGLHGRPAAHLSGPHSTAEPSSAVVRVSEVSETPKAVDRWTVAFALYACVTMVLLLRFVRAYRTVSQLKASSGKISLPLRNELGGANAPDVYESDAVHVPLAGGVRSAFVLLPATWKSWDEWKLRAVLTHEFTHIRRGDPFVRMIAAINTSVYWFNPLSWFVEGMLSSLSEEASDEAAVLKNGDPVRYAQVLLQFARSAQKRGRLRLTSVAMAKQRIRSRVDAVLHMQSPRNGTMTRAGWIATTAMALPVVYAASALQVVPAVAVGPGPQAPSERLRFEAATIKPSDPAGRGFIGGACHGTDSPPSSGFFPVEPIALGRCRFSTMTLKMLIQQAYGLRGDSGSPPAPDADDMVSGGPGWASSDRYDIEAKAESPTTVQNMMLMLRSLLEDRFRMKFHLGSKDLTGFALLVAKSGPKLVPASGNEDKPGIARTDRSHPWVGRNTPVKWLATFLSGAVGKQVVDETGLTGTYNFTLTFTPLENRGIDALIDRLPPEVQAKIPGRPDPNGPSIFTAVQEQLGLRLESRKVPSETIVIDAAERPAAN